jgi:uncharacterized SAM-binding protein YcdF (DUF218 family)
MPQVNRNADHSPKKHLHRNILVASAVLLLLAVLVYALRAQILTGIADLLVVNDPLQPADIIFVLNGDYNTRPFWASELYEQGLAHIIIIARSEMLPAEKLGLVPNDTDVSIGVMKKLGVPPEKIVVLPVVGGVTSTFDEAIALRQYIESHNIHSLILLTSAFHTRRAKWIFDRELAGLPITLAVVAVPHYGFDQTNWWQSEDGLITLNNEYIKLAYYFLKYR